MGLKEIHFRIIQYMYYQVYTKLLGFSLIELALHQTFSKFFLHIWWDQWISHRLYWCNNHNFAHIFCRITRMSFRRPKPTSSHLKKEKNSLDPWGEILSKYIKLAKFWSGRRQNTGQGSFGPLTGGQLSACTEYNTYAKYLDRGNLVINY